MRKVIFTLLAVFCLTTMVFAINNADPDPDLAEKLVQKALLKSITDQQVKGSGIPLAAGDYYIPKGSHPLGFDSLHIAVDSINANGVTGTVNLILDADTLREPSFTFNADLSVTNNVVVKPAAGRDVVLIVAGGASHGNGDQMIGFDKGFVTFDGSNNGTDTRNLVVTTEQTSVEVPFGLNTAAADTVVIKNLIIKNLDNGVTNFKYGVVTNDVAGIQGFTVENCQIGSAEFPVYRDGVAVWGSSSGATQGIVLDNDIYAGCRGIATYVVNDCNFSGNVINMMPTTSATTYSYVHGIYLTGASGPTTIHNNIINCLEAATVSGTYVVGLAFAGNSEGAGEIISVVNNMINIGAPDETFNTYGIGLRSANPMGNIDAYHNTIVVNEHSSTLTSYAVGNHTNGTGSVDMELKNNIIINQHTGNTASAAIGLVPTTSVLVSDYNLLASAQNFVKYQGTDYADLAAWQAAAQDLNSVSKSVNFVSATDLHLTGASVGDFDLAGTPLTSIVADIDGDTRSTSYPYMGADEASVALEPPPPTVVINEVGEPYTMSNTYNDSYIELYNVTDAAIDVSGWEVHSVAVSKASSHAEIPSGTQIAANGYLIVTRDRTKFLADYGAYVDENIVVNPTTTSGSIVYIANSYYFQLKDASGNIVDETSSTISWDKKVFEKISPIADGTIDDNWYSTYQFSPVEGTPGQVNSTPPPATPYTISEIQDTTGTGSADSPKVGEYIRTTGIVTGAFSDTYTIQDGTGGFSGIWINDDLAVSVGDEVTVKGFVAESYNLTVINADSSGVNSSGNTLPVAEVLTTGAVSSEQWEGVLVQTSGACDNADLGYGEWSVDDGSGSVVMDDMGYVFTPTAAVEYQITGPLYYSYGAFKIIPRSADDVVDLTPQSYDLELTFEDDSDVANWGVYDGTSGSTTVAHNATGGVDGTGAIEFGDGGYGFYIKRPISATVGTQYNFSIDIKNVGWDNPSTYPITIAIEGLDATPVSANINSLASFTTINLTGIVTNADGYIVIAGSNTSAANAGGEIKVWIDNLVFDDAADIPDLEPPTLVAAEGINDTTVVVEFSEFVDPVTAAVLTNYSVNKEIGNPKAALVFENLVTLTLDTLDSDTFYTMTVNNVQDTSGNVIAANSEITFMWQEWVPGPDLFFSEYIEGSSSNKALEIYNPTDADIDLSGYALVTGNSAGNYWYAPEPLAGILPAGDTYVIINPSFDFSLIDSAAVVDSIWGQYVTYFNGDDPRAIGKLLSGSWSDTEPNYVIIDAIGDINGDPGTAWDVAGVSGATAEHTLIRKATVTMGNAGDWTFSAGADEASSEWIVMPQNFVTYLGSHPHTDFAGPEIVSVIAVGDSLIQVKYSEKVDSASAVNVANYSIDGGIGTPVDAGIICMHVVTLKLGAGQLLAPNTDYTLTVNNVTDQVGFVIEENTTVTFQNIVPGERPDDIVNSDFETTAGAWWAPTGSGSTWGISTSSSFALSSEAAFHGAKSKKLTVINDPAKTGWFVREYNPDRPDVAVDSKIFMYVKASNPDIQIRFLFRDDGTGGDNEYLASPWVDVTAHEDDWQVIQVDIMTTPLTSWVVVGDGVIGSSNVISIDAIQLQCPNDVDAVLYFDKLTERPNNSPPGPFTLLKPTEGYELTNNDLVQDSLVELKWTKATDPEGNAITYECFILDADQDSVVFNFTTSDTSKLIDAPTYEDNGSYKAFVLAKDTWGAFSSSDTVNFTVNMPEVGIGDEVGLPKVFALHQNYPNPFNPITTIKYDLPKDAHVRIMIYDLMGRQVRTLVNARQRAGYQTIQWDARDNYGKMVSSGYYIYVMQADKFHKSQKMILLK